MILDFSNFNETEEESPKIELVNTQIRKQKDIWAKSKKGTENVYDESED